MSALRAAAALLRERAEATDVGAWEWRDYGSTRSAFGLMVGEKTFAHLYAAERDATFIATMDPTVALAVADWLDAENTACKGDEYYATVEALAVADAILAGGAS